MKDAVKRLCNEIAGTSRVTADDRYRLPTTDPDFTMSTRNTALDADAPIETETPDGPDDDRLIPLQPRHGPQPKRLR